MMYELTNEDKINVINGRLRSLEISKYDVELSIEEENSLESPNAQIVTSHQTSIANIEAKIAVLQSKLDELS